MEEASELTLKLLLTCLTTVSKSWKQEAQPTTAPLSRNCYRLADRIQKNRLCGLGGAAQRDG